MGSDFNKEIYEALFLMSTIDNLFNVKVLSHEEILKLFDEHSDTWITAMCDDILFQISDDIYLGWNNIRTEELSLFDMRTDKRLDFSLFEAGALVAQLMTANRWLYEYRKSNGNLNKVGNCDINAMFLDLNIQTEVSLGNETITLSLLDVPIIAIELDLNLVESLSYSIIACTRHLSTRLTEANDSDYTADESEILQRAESSESELAACFTNDMSSEERRTALYKLRETARNQTNIESNGE